MVADTVMKDQNDIDNHNVNINCKENGVVIEVNEVHKFNVNNNYERIEVIEECNDENKSVKDELNHDNVEERNLEDGVTNDELNILLVVTTQDVLEFQKVPKEQIKTSLSDKKVSTILVVTTTDKKTVSKHAEISKIHIKIEGQKNTIGLEAHKNTPYSCYTFIYIIICMKIFEWKCDQIFQELLNRGTIIRGKNSSCSTLIRRFVDESFQSRITCNIPKVYYNY